MVLCLGGLAELVVWVPHRLRHRKLHFQIICLRAGKSWKPRSSRQPGVSSTALFFGFHVSDHWVVSLGSTVLVAHFLCGMLDVTLKFSGMLGTRTVGLTTDAFGPISSNAGGTVEMSQLDELVPTLLTQQGGSRQWFCGWGCGSCVFRTVRSFLRRSSFGAMMPYALATLTMKTVPT